MSKKTSFTLVFSLLFLLTTAQNSNIGILPVKNYAKKEYKAGTQNWEVKQDGNGVVYFANNSGLLQFDGTYWQLYPIANQTIVRSICIAEDGKIYVGGQGEFGYFSPQENGELEYHSFTHLVPEKNKDFTDIWDIEITEDGIFFKSGEAIFKIFGGILDAYSFEGGITFMGKMGQKIIAQIGLESLWHYENGNFQFYQKLENLNSSIKSLIHTEDQFFFMTLHNGVFKFEDNHWVKFPTQYDELFFDNYPQYSATALPNGKIAIGSPPNGLFIFDSNWKLEYKADKQKGLQNNGILSLESDKHGNLWLGLDNGIDYLEANSPITKIYPDGDLEGTGYTACIHDHHIYLGTNNGLYVKPWGSNENLLNSNSFQLINKTEAQVWGLNTIDNQLFLGHHNGAIKIKKDKAFPLNNGIGTWLFKKLNETQIIVGQYNGLSLLESQNGDWQYSKKLDGLDESSRILAKGKNNIFWMAHPYRGIFKVMPNIKTGQAIFQFYDKEKGLPSNQFNHVFEIKNKAIFTGETGVFEFNQEEDKFQSYEPLAAFFDANTRIRTLKEDELGNIWFAADNEVGVLKINDSGLERNIKKIIIPELSDKLVGGFEYIYPHDNKHVFFASEKGFILLDPEKYSKIDTSVHVLISEVRLFPNDTLLFSGKNLPKTNLKELELSRTQNHLVFKFSSPVFNEEKRILYQTKMEGLDEDWLPWTDKTEREINNLLPGDYIFQVRSKNGFNSTSETKSFKFSIAPPWYATKTAQFVFGILFLGLLSSVLFFQQNRFENQKAELQSVHQQKVAEHQQVVEKTEAEINRLQTENLESEINFKTKELALATMHLVQKNEMLTRIQRELKKMMSYDKLNSVTKSEIRRLINLLAQDQILNDDWSQFEVHFDQVHSNFLKRLRAKYPQLSPNDFKLCAYLKMNLTTKEIAPLMNISVRGVEASRYRLRKKLNIPSGENLIEFIMNI